MTVGARRIIALAYCLYGLSLAAPIWLTTHFPSEDGPAHLYWTEVYRDLGNAQSRFHPYYERSATWNTPNLSYFGLQLALSKFVDPAMAQRLILTFILLLWTGATAFLSHVARGQLTLGSFAALLLFHSWALYVGLFSFLLGVPLLILAGGLVAREVLTRGTSRHRSRLTWEGLALPVLGVAVYYSHLVDALPFFLLVVGGAWFARDVPSRSIRLLLSAAPVGLLVLGYVNSATFGNRELSWWSAARTIKSFLGLSFWQGLAANGLGFQATRVALALALAVLLADSVRSWLAGDLPSGRRLILAVGGCLAVAYLVVPGGVGAGGFFKERIQLAMWAIVLPTLAAPSSRRLQAVVALALIAAGAWQLATFTGRARRFGREYAAVLREADAIPAGSRIEFDQPQAESDFEGSFVAPLLEGGEIAARCNCIWLGGFHPAHPFYWIRTRAERPPVTDFVLQVRSRPSTDSAAGAGARLRGGGSLVLITCRAGATAASERGAP